MSVTVSGTGTDNLAGLLRPRKTATPIIINGDMQIAQRATSGTYTGTEDEIETCDRWKGFIGSAGTFTNTQDTDVPTGYGFAKAWKIDCTTADSSLSSTDFFFVRQSIEGQNLQVFKKGTSLAETFTLAFWVKSHVTGTYTCELEDKDNSRSVSKSYTISSANTWEKKVLNFPADTTGAFGNDNGASLDVKFWLCAGSGFSSGTLQETWDSTTTTEQVASGQVNLASSTDNNWWFTGVQLEVGTFSSTDLPDFQFEDRGTSLNRCRRYCFVSGYSGDGGAKCIADFGIAIGTTLVDSYMDLKPEMRTAPSMTNSGALNISNGSTGFSATAIAINSTINSRQFAGVRTTCSSGLTAGDLYRIEEASSSGAIIVLDAEL